MVTSGSIFIRRGMFLILSILLVMSQVVAQERGLSGPAFACVQEQINPDNEIDDFIPAVADNYIVWTGYAAGETGEIFVKNRGTTQVTQITNNDYEDRKPQVDGEYIVWEFDNPDNGTKDIALHNLGNGQTDTLGSASYDDVSPLIEGNYVVWNQEGFLSNVRYYNVVTETLNSIAGLVVAGDRYSLYAINDGRILYVYRDFQGGTTYYDSLYVLDIEDSTTTLVSGGLPVSDGKSDAQIDGNVVVWENWNPPLATAYEIYAYNMTSTDLIRITNDNDIDMEPAVKGGYVAYTSMNGTTYEMRLRNLKSGDDIVVRSTEEEIYYDPFIDGKKIVWQSSEGIHVHPMGGTRTYKVTDYEGDPNLVLEGNRIFWSGQEAGEQDADIFMADCGFSPEIVSQPQDIEIAPGGVAMLSVAAKGDGNLKYQWYDNAGETPVIGATSATFVTAPLTENKQFYVKVSSKYGNVNSRLATVVVSEGGATATPTSEATATLQPGVTPSSTLEVTLTPSLTPTPTQVGSVQILPNTDFELDADGNKIPDGWTARGTTLRKADKLKRNKLNDDGTMKVVAYSGEAAFMFKGNPNGSKSKIQYKLTDFGVIVDNTWLEFSVYVNRFKVAPGTTIGKVKIKFSDGSKETLELLTPTEQAYTSVSDTLLVDLDGRTIEKFKAEFSTSIKSGKFMIDKASLLVFPALAGEAAENLIPLP